MEQIGLTKFDIEKHIKNGTMAYDIASYIDSVEGCGNSFEEIAGISKEEFIEKVNATNKDTLNFMPGADLVIVDGEKVLVEYVL